MRIPTTVLAAFSLASCSTLQSGTEAVRIGDAARQARAAEGWDRRTYIYSAAALARSGLPDQLVAARQADFWVNLPAGCKPPAPAGPAPLTAVPAAIVPMAMFIFNTILGEIERGLAAREKRRLASLSDQFTANAAVPAFPLGAAEAVSCLIVDDVETRSDRSGRITEFRPRAVYALQLRRIGRAFVIEPIGVRIARSKIIRDNMTPALNVDLSLALTTVPESSKGPSLFGYPAYNVHFENVQLDSADQPKNNVPDSATARSIVMPLPQDADTPTTLAAAVTESHVSLTRERERIALEQAHRKALFEAVSEMLKTKLGE